MKMRLNGRAIICLCLMVLAAAAFLQATRWPLSARLFPMVVSVPLFLLALAEFAFSAFAAKKDPRDQGGALDGKLAQGQDPVVVRKHTLWIFAWCGGFFLMVLLFGFSVAVPLFVFLYLRPYSKESWGTSIALTAVAGGCFYGLFIWLLNVHFEDGLLQQGLKLIGLMT